nr:hypothetical protein GCM10020093_088830 [Planobispora longispora]
MVRRDPLVGVAVGEVAHRPQVGHGREQLQRRSLDRHADHALVELVGPADQLDRELPVLVVAAGVVLVDEAADGAEDAVDPAALLGEVVQPLGDQTAQGGGGMPGEVLSGLLVDHAEPYQRGQLAAQRPGRAVGGLGQFGAGGAVEAENRVVQGGLGRRETQRLQGIR